MRDIRLFRSDKQLVSVDFYDYLLTGQKPKDIKLQLDDVIFIPKRIKTVTINGEVKRPGVYELKKDEGINEILEFAGGLKVTAYLERAQINRIVPFNDRKKLGMDRIIVDMKLNNEDDNNLNFPVYDGDKIRIFSILDKAQNVVTINGAIERPGDYDIKDSLKLSELLINAGGLLGDAYFDRADIIRTKPDFSEILIKLNLGKAVQNHIDHDLFLQKSDVVKIYSKTDMVAKTYVGITGHVKRPGRYSLKEDMTLYDLIFLAGGFIDKEFKEKTFLDRGELIRSKEGSNKKQIFPFDLEKVLEKKDLALTYLLPEDMVRIYSVDEVRGGERYVTISGHVKKPGIYELFEENMTLYDLLFIAGGFDYPEHKAATYMERADLIRFESNQITKSIIPFKLIDVLNKDEEISLVPGDEVVIYSKIMFNKQKNVKISGSIIKPGTYLLKKNMNVKDLILEAKGLAGDYKNYKIEISRLNLNNTEESVYAKSLVMMMNDELSVINNENKRDEKDIILLPYDYIFVRPNTFSDLKQHIVSISGHVKHPGQYALYNTEQTVYDIIERAGGFLPQAYPLASTFIRENNTIQLDLEKVIRNPRSKENIKLRNGDSIFVAKHPEFFKITGEVSVPGNYQFIKGKRVFSYITDAGGLTLDAEIDDIWCTYPNGKTIRCSKPFRNPKVLDGSIITVGKKKKKSHLIRLSILKN